MFKTLVSGDNVIFENKIKYGSCVIPVSQEHTKVQKTLEVWATRLNCT